SLELARERASSWGRSVEFLHCDIAEDPERIPKADLLLALNLFPYLPDVAQLISGLRRNHTADRIIIRQWDGGTMRIGPMSAEARCAIASSLHAALEGSALFAHSGLDQTYELIRRTGFSVERLEFDLTQRHAPFPQEFEEYFLGTVAWMRDHLSDDAR